MKKVVIHRPGGYDKLTLETGEDPVPGPGEIAIAVESAGVNYADTSIRMGLYASAKELIGWPITPGFEIAGKVTAVGEGVDDISVGDNVLSVSRFCGYTSHRCVPRWQAFPIPESFDVTQAGGFPVVAITAWFALRYLAHIRSGQSLLVHSAAGGVGSMVVQMAKHLGARVVGVVGASHKVDAVRELGADAVVDKSTQDLWSEVERVQPGGFDVICDANGYTTLQGSYDHLAPMGKLIVYGFAGMLPRDGKVRWLRLARDWLRTPRFNPLDLTNDNKSVMAFNLSYLFDARDMLQESMSELVGWVNEGALRMPKVTTFPLDDVAKAHQAIESGQTVGKLVLVP